MIYAAEHSSTVQAGKEASIQGVSERKRALTKRNRRRRHQYNIAGRRGTGSG